MAGNIGAMTEKQHIYFIREYVPEAIFHGGIGNIDIEQLLLQQGATPLHLPGHYDFSAKNKLQRLWFLIKQLLTLPRHSIVFFQYPMHARLNKTLAKWLTLRKSINVVCILADINGLKYDNKALLADELKWFRRYRYFIVHNNAMQYWVEQNIPGSQCTQLEFFDFLARPTEKSRSKSPIIAFAGNLDKSRFLEHMDQVQQHSPGLHFMLYGPYVSEAMQKMPNVTYKGIVEPYKLPETIEGSFGLVWDGDNIAGEGGSMGQYMQYITHHKVSLYILSNMPLIIYEKAGAAELVKKYGIGITINSLFEIEEKINTITEEDYQRMCANTKVLAAQISSGGGFKKAFQKITGMITINS